MQLSSVKSMAGIVEIGLGRFKIDFSNFASFSFSGDLSDVLSAPALFMAFWIIARVAFSILISSFLSSSVGQSLHA